MSGSKTHGQSPSNACPKPMALKRFIHCAKAAVANTYCPSVFSQELGMRRGERCEVMFTIPSSRTPPCHATPSEMSPVAPIEGPTAQRPEWWRSNASSLQRTDTKRVAAEDRRPRPLSLCHPKNPPVVLKERGNKSMYAEKLRNKGVPRCRPGSRSCANEDLPIHLVSYFRVSSYLIQNEAFSRNCAICAFIFNT